jgi:hypothetical protein
MSFMERLLRFLVYACLGAAVGSGALLLWLIFRHGPQSGSEAQLLAAGLTFAASLVASIVAGAGALLKHSLDSRNAELARQAERRLQLEAAIRAVDLLQPNQGGPVSKERQTAVLFMLAGLQAVPLALTLLRHLVSHDAADPSTAAEIVSRGLSSPDPHHQQEAAAILLEHPSVLLQPNGEARLPGMLRNPPWQLSRLARDWVVQALVRLLLSRPCKDWGPEGINIVFLVLHWAWEHEEDPGLRSGLTACLYRGTALYGSDVVLDAPWASEYVKVDDLKETLEEGLKEREVAVPQYERLADRISDWCLPNHITVD